MTDDFYKACMDEAYNLGDPLNSEIFPPYIVVGAMIAQAAYAHLKDRSIQVYIALYTAILTYLDDKYEHHVAALTSFNERFVRGDDQADKVLQILAKLLYELPHRYSSIASSMIITSTMNYITSLILELETSEMPVGVACSSILYALIYTLIAFKGCSRISNFLEIIVWNITSLHTLYISLRMLDSSIYSSIPWNDDFRKYSEVCF